MKLTPPKNITFLISVVLGVLGILGSFASLGFVSTYALWFLVVGFVILALSVLLKDL